MSMRPGQLSLNQRLGVVAFVLGLGALFASPRPVGTVTLDARELALITQGKLDHVSAEELADWIIQGRGDYRLIDVREAADYAEYHIPTAENASLASEVWLAGSGGAGASTAAHIGQGPVQQQDTKTTSVLANGASSVAILSEYFARMQNRDANPELDIYTPATRRMLREWTMTPAQFDNVVKTYRRCSAQAERVDASGRLSVIRYPARQRQCAPWFFEKINGRWALDLTMMQKAIRFGRDNSWHFELGVEHPYEYAFTDWTFDAYGFPQQR